MKLIKLTGAALLAVCILVSSGCSSMTNTGKGALIGGGGGGALGAGIGALIGGGKGALPEDTKVEQTTDQNGLQAIKVTFPGGILFPTNGTTLSPSAKQDLSKFVVSLRENPLTDVQIFGFTDNTGGYAVNERVSTGRADAVLSYLVNSGIQPTRLSAQGVPMADYVASNDTPEGRAQNRRVEIYITASPQMIQDAENGTL